MRRPLWATVPALLHLAATSGNAAVFPFEVLGVSENWLVVRENIPARADDTSACTYPGLDPSQYVGATVHFFRRSDEDRRGRLLPLEKPAESMTLYAHGHQSQGCTSAANAKQLWGQIASRAASLGVALAATPPAAVVLGAPVPVNACNLLGGPGVDKPPCRQEFQHTLKEGAIRIAVSLTAVPEAPDLKTCQFVGYRLAIAIAVSGLGFGQPDSTLAPGGFANHFDCRSQQSDALRLYHVGSLVVLMGGFSGRNIAGRTEYPFAMVFPARPEE